MTRVIKIGGRPQLDPSLPTAIAAAQQAAPGSLLIVHGGGDEVSTLQRLYGVEARFAGGRRVTSALDLEIIRMALSGSANKRLVAALIDAGVSAIGLSGEDGRAAHRRPAGPGAVRIRGDACRGEHSPAYGNFWTRGLLPVLSPVSRSTDPAMGVTLNVNGDDAAAAIAAALGAEELLLVSDVPGVLLGERPLAALGPEEAQRLIDDGTARGGMAAKLQAALSALDGGVQRVRISDIAAITDSTRGTALTRVGSMAV
jgi:acetylglutamate kinase